MARIFANFGPLTEIDRKYTRLIAGVSANYLSGNYDLLQDVLLDGVQEEIQPNDLPGLSVAFQFEDDSSLDISFRFSVDQELIDVQVAGITGYASELLAIAVKDRKSCLLAQMIPLTESERRVLMTQNKQEVALQLQRSLELCKMVRTAFSFAL